MNIFGGRVSLAVDAVACGGQPMNARTTAILPADLEKTRRRFEQWRQVRKVHTPIPESLWAAAVKLAGRYGVSRTARTLRVGYYSLQERVARATACSAGSSPMVREAKFLELAVPSGTGTGECLLEWEDVSGAEDAGPPQGPRDARRGRAEPQFLGGPAMIQITPQMRILVAQEPADFRRGIDGLAQLCQQRLCPLGRRARGEKSSWRGVGDVGRVTS